MTRTLIIAAVTIALVDMLAGVAVSQTSAVSGRAGLSGPNPSGPSSSTSAQPMAQTVQPLMNADSAAAQPTARVPNITVYQIMPAQAPAPTVSNLSAIPLVHGTQLNNRIAESLKELDYDSSRVHVTQQDGKVALEGTVNTQTEADQLLQQARIANGGVDVIDNLQVENISQ